MSEAEGGEMLKHLSRLNLPPIWKLRKMYLPSHSSARPALESFKFRRRSSKITVQAVDLNTPTPATTDLAALGHVIVLYRYTSQPHLLN